MQTATIGIYAIVLSLCFGCNNKNTALKSFRPSSTFSLIDHLEIKDDSITAKDYAGTIYKGVLTADNTADFKINNTIVSYPIRTTASDSLHFGSTEFFEVSDEDENQNVYFNHYTNLHAGVVYPFSSQVTERRLILKLRDQSHPERLLLGGKYSSLDELSKYAPHINDNDSTHKLVKYDDVLIMVEQHSSVKDLLNIQQQLFSNNRIDRSIILTSPVSLGRYSAIIDYKINNYSLVEELYNRYQHYLNLDLPPRPPVLWDKSYDDLISSGDLLEIQVENAYDLERQGYLFRNSARIVVQINEDISMEDYLLVLATLQELRLKYGGDIRTHFYD